MKLGNSPDPNAQDYFDMGMEKAADICESWAKIYDLMADNKKLTKYKREVYHRDAKTCREMVRSIRASVDHAWGRQVTEDGAMCNSMPHPSTPWWKFWKWTWGRDIRASAVEDVEIDLPKVTDGMLKRAKLQNWDNHD